MGRGLPIAVLLGLAAGVATGGPQTGARHAVGGPAALVLRDDDPKPDDPFPIRRLRATESQLPELVKQFDPGPLVRLPRDEFEARVRAAGRAAAEAKVAPRVIDSRFKAVLAGGDLVGTAELDLMNPGDTPRFLTLDPLRLALGPATWGDGREALVGVPSGATATAVWVDRSGPQTLKFAWSATGVTEPGEQRFELRMPTSPAAMLDLELPAGRVPTAAPDVLLAGPFPVSGTPPRTSWRFRFGGRSRLDFAVRPAGNPGVSAAAALAAKYEILPGQLAAGFEYDLRPAKGTVGEWVFDVDPGLRVTDVVTNNRAGWTIDPPTAPGGPRRLRVMLRQPRAGGKILVSAVAPFPDPAHPADGPLPGIRPVGAYPDDETIELRVAPGIKIDSWSSNDYRLTDSQFTPDQTHVFSLIGTLIPPGQQRPYRRLPTVRASFADPEFSTTEQITWRLGTTVATAAVRVGVRVRRGTLFQFALRAPDGYALTRATSPADDLIAHATTAGKLTTIEFARPVATGQSAELMFEFSGPAIGTTPRDMPFPEFNPIGASGRNGILAINPGSLWVIDPVPGPGTRLAGWIDPVAPAIPPDAAAAFRYRDAGPVGTLSLTPTRAEFTAEAVSRLTPVPGAVVGTTTFAIRLQAGALNSVLISEREGGATGRAWRVIGGGNAVASVLPVPVPALAPQVVGWANRVAAAEAARGMGRTWLIRFARPVTTEVILETTATRAFSAEPGADEWTAAGEAFARWRVPGASHYRGPDASGKVAAEAPPQPSWEFTGVYLVTAVRSTTDVVIAYGGTVRARDASTLPVRLPPGAAVRAAGVGGRWLEPGMCRPLGDGALHLPVSAAGPVRFEVRYRLPMEFAGPVACVRSPAPILPGEGGEARRWWVFAPDVMPGWPVQAWERGTAADLPGFLGDSLAGETGSVVVSRLPVAEVRVATARSADAAGIVFAAMLFVLAWAGGRRRHPFAGLIVTGGLLGVGIAVLLGPPWWQRAAATPLVVGLLSAAGMVVARGFRTAAPAVAGLVAIGLLLGRFPTLAQPVTPATVVLLPVDANGREIVVAPKAVLDRFVVKPTPPGVLLTPTEYAITGDDAGARVVAKVVAHALDDGDAVAMLAFPDARLERVMVNGVASFPAAPRPGVYAVPLTGKGRHEIEVRFAVAATGTGPERELRFGVPECPATRVVVDLPGSARQVQVVGRVGRRVSTEGDRSRVEVDVGATKTVQVRWRDGAGGAAAMKVREGCVWDVSEAGAELTACYLVRVEQGTVSALAFDVPAELDTLGATARSLESGGTAALRDWSVGAVKGGFRPVQLDFQVPTAGRLLVVLTCVPRATVTRQPVLRFPRPILPTAPAEPDAAYGLRARGVAIEEFGRSGVIDFTADALALDFAGVPDLRLDPAVPLRVFRPTPGGGAELRPTLRPAADPPAIALDTLWHVGPKRAAASGTVQWTGRIPDALEFAVPGVHVLGVHGSDVAGWARQGGTVQVWLKRPAREGEVEWLGTVDAPATPFDAVTPRVADARLVTNTVRVLAEDGFAATVERPRAWEMAPSGEPSGFQTATVTASPVRVTLTPIRRPAQANAFGWFGSLRGARAVPLAPEPRPVLPTAAAIAIAAPANELLEDPRWVWPVSVAVGWTVAVAVLALLLARFPRATWPEQFAILGGLFGAAVIGTWWVGVVAWVVARGAGLAGLFARAPAPPARA